MTRNSFGPKPRPRTGDLSKSITTFQRRHKEMQRKLDPDHDDFEKYKGRKAAKARHHSSAKTYAGMAKASGAKSIASRERSKGVKKGPFKGIRRGWHRMASRSHASTAAGHKERSNFHRSQAKKIKEVYREMIEAVLEGEPAAQVVEKRYLMRKAAKWVAGPSRAMRIANRKTLSKGISMASRSRAIKVGAKGLKHKAVRVGAAMAAGHVASKAINRHQEKKAAQQRQQQHA